MIVLVLGGSRSGKSAVGERLVADMADGAPVTYLATLRLDRAPDMADRVAEHRARRPDSWTTIESTDLAAELRRTAGPVMVDSLGTWVAGDPGVDAGAFVEALRSRDGSTVVISDEVGLGVHPETATGRNFRDRLGAANVLVADAADRVVLVVAGRILELPRA